MNPTMNRIINSINFNKLKTITSESKQIEEIVNTLATELININHNINSPFLRNSIFNKTRFHLALLQITENKKKEK